MHAPPLAHCGHAFVCMHACMHMHVLYGSRDPLVPLVLCGLVAHSHIGGVLDCGFQKLCRHTCLRGKIFRMLLGAHEHATARPALPRPHSPCPLPPSQDSQCIIMTSFRVVHDMGCGTGRGTGPGHWMVLEALAQPPAGRCTGNPLWALCMLHYLLNARASSEAVCDATNA